MEYVENTIRRMGFIPKHVGTFDILMGMGDYKVASMVDPSLVLYDIHDGHLFLLTPSGPTEVFGDEGQIIDGIQKTLKATKKFISHVRKSSFRQHAGRKIKIR